MKVIAVIQTKFKSLIFPNKGLKEISGKPILQIIIERLRLSTLLDDIVVATTTNREDEKILAVSKRLGVKAYTGPEFDVLKRILKVVQRESADIVVRIKGNYPLVDPYYMDSLLKSHIEKKFDLSYNEWYGGIIYGMGVEIISSDILKQIDTMDLNDEERQLGTLYIRENEDKFKVLSPVFKIQRPNYKVCVDDEKDLEVVREIFKRVQQPSFEQVARFLDENPILVKYNTGNEKSAEIGLDKILLFPDKVHSILHRDDNALDTAYPISVELSLTSTCMNQCVWCSDYSLRKRLKGELDKEVIFRLIHELERGGTRGIVVEGGGEPTLHPHFKEIVRNIKELNLKVGLITNGIKLDYDDIINKFDWIRVSLDTSTREEYNRLKGIDAFDQVLNNIYRMVDSKVMIGVGYVVYKHNIEHLEKLVLRLKDYGVEYIYFRPVIDHKELAVDTNLNYLKKYETDTFSILTDAMEENKITGNGGVPCVAHSVTTVVTADGGVYLCGRLNKYDWWEPIGNLYRDNFHSIWTSEKRKMQSKLVSDPSFCLKHCPECRITKYNLLFKRTGQVKTIDFI